MQSRSPDTRIESPFYIIGRESQGKQRPEEGLVMAKRKLPKPPPGYRYIFRAYRTDPKTGKVLHASTFGLKAWPILVPA